MFTKKKYFDQKQKEYEKMLDSVAAYHAKLDSEIANTQAQLASLSAQEVPTSGDCDYTELFKKQAELKVYLDTLQKKKAEGVTMSDQKQGQEFIKDILAHDAELEKNALQTILPSLDSILKVLAERDESRKECVELIRRYETNILHNGTGTAYALSFERTPMQSVYHDILSAQDTIQKRSGI